MATRKSSRKTSKTAREAAQPKPRARAKAKSTAKKAPARKAPSPKALPRKAPSRRRRAKPESLRLRAIAPALTCGDLDRSLDFYVRGLGFVVAEEWVRDGKRAGAMLRAGTCELGLGQDDWAKGRDRAKGVGCRLYLETIQDIDALAARLKAAGYPPTSGPLTTVWAERELSVDDPDGFHLTVFRALPKSRT